MRTALKRLILMRGGDGSASFLARPTGAATLTINGLTVSSATTVDWGDGSTDTYTGSGTRTHAYAGAGTYQVRILQPENVTMFDLANTVGMPVTVNSADLKSLVNVTDFRVRALPATSTGTFNSADVSAWRPGYFWLYAMPTGYTGTFNSADVSAWRPGYFWLYAMPASYTVTITGGGFSTWTGVNYFQMQSNSLSSAAVDQILADLYTAAQSRTVTGGIINLSGTNAAPGGTYAAACPPTTGKEYAYELINDSCGVIAAGETWATITVTGGLP